MRAYPWCWWVRISRFLLGAQVPLEEFVGLHGPVRVMIENVLTALISNALSIGSLTLMPFTLGRLVGFFLSLVALVEVERIAPSQQTRFSEKEPCLMLLLL